MCGSIVSPFTWTALETALDLVRPLGYTPLTCEHYFRHRQAGTIPEKSIVFRIDVDRSPEAAVMMAKLFAEAEVAASFFYRVHAPLYDVDKPENTKALRLVHELGFEVGIHCEPLVVAHVTRREPEAILQGDIERLCRITGTGIRGAASHGDARYPDINNLDFWSNHAPSEFGLWYEVYDSRTFGLFQTSRYVSDSALTAWKAYDRGIFRPDDRRSLVEHLRDSSLPVYVLLHPFLFGAPHLVEPPASSRTEREQSDG